MSLSKPISDFVASTLNGQIEAGDTAMNIGSGLQIPSTNGVLQIDYDSSCALSADGGPETITYGSYNSSTGAVTGMTRGAANTDDHAHDSGASVQAGPSVLWLTDYDRKNASDQTIIGKNNTRATRFVQLTEPQLVVNIADLNNTNWNDVNVRAYTSDRTYAITGNTTFTSSTAGHVLKLRSGDSTADATAEYVGVVSIANSWATSSHVTKVDSNQIFSYKGTHANITGVYISITGYWEYVD